MTVLGLVACFVVPLLLAVRINVFCVSLGVLPKSLAGEMEDKEHEREEN